jgi:hypothetical protein
MTDDFSSAGLGECVSVFEDTVNCEVYSGKTVTKGQVVEVAAEVAGGLPKVQPAQSGSLIVLGVALKSGNAGAVISVLTRGIVKVTAGANGTTVGKKVMVDTTEGTVTDADAYDKAFARALHTLAEGDTGLILL